MDLNLYFKSLSDKTRLRLLNLLLYHELNVNEIVGIMAMGQSRISRHLKILADSGLLASRRDGLWIFYSAVSGGRGREFIDSIKYLLKEDRVYRQDSERAQKIIEDRKRETSRFFDFVSHDWDRMKRTIIGDFDLTGVIRERLHPCRVAVDLGCGTGDLLPVLEGMAERVIGVDNSPRMLDEARKRFSIDGHKIDLRLGDMEHLPLRDGEADFAIVNMVLHHLTDPAAGIRETYRILNRNNPFFIVDFVKHEDETMRRKFQDRWLGFTPVEVRQWLTGSGFKIRETLPFVLSSGFRINLYISDKK